MRIIDISSQFKKDLKKAIKQNKDISKLDRIVNLLQEDLPLPEKCHPHILSGNWNGYHECHIEPDWLLIYKPHNNNILRLARIGSHSELFK